MSDDLNMNNGEETAALFVSSQKKKQAEEEARIKAEAEQAKRDAAEAEVRRMEAEVEERKRKAEEERLALEEAARAAEAKKANVADKLKASVNVDEIKSNMEEIKSKVKDKTEGKPKLPIYIGAGAAAVLIIVMILVFALKGKGGKIDLETLEFAKEYTVTNEDSSVTFYYPESLYTGFAETEKDGSKTLVEAEPDSKKTPALSIQVSTPLFSAGESAVASAKGVQSIITELAAKSMEGYNVSEEKTGDVSAQAPGKYFYDATGSDSEGNMIAVATWLEPDSNGNIVAVEAAFTEKTTDASNVNALRDKFEEKNSDNAFKIPGANPPASVETDGALELDEMHFGVVVPKDRFKKLDEDVETIDMWADDNGAIYAVVYKELEINQEYVWEHPDETRPKLEELVESGAGVIGLPDLDSRMKINDSWPGDYKYNAKYKDVFGGVTYIEWNHSSYWTDERTQKYYIYDLVLLAPEANEDVYGQLFEKGWDRLQDL